MIKKRTNCIDILTPDDQEDLFHLRSTCYERYYKQNVNLEALRWNSWDERFINLGLYHEGQLISLLRVSHLKTLEDFKRIMLFDLNLDKYAFPLVVLNRAATVQSFESKGYHSLLRLLALRLSYHSQAGWIFGTFKKDSNRIKQLTEMGYDFEINPNPWQSFLKSEEPTYVVSLDLKSKFSIAENRLLKSTSELIPQYPLLFDFSEATKKMTLA